MSVLSSLRLTPEQVRRMTASARKVDPTIKAPKSGKNRRPAVSWLWQMLLKMSEGQRLTLRSIMNETGKTRGTVAAAVSSVLRHGLIEVEVQGHGGRPVSTWVRTEKPHTPPHFASRFYKAICRAKPGTKFDYFDKRATSRQAALHNFNRGVEAGVLVKQGTSPHRETVWRRTAK